MIEIKVEGLERLESLLGVLESDVIVRNVTEQAFRILEERVYNELMRNPEIPQFYKDALYLIHSPETGYLEMGTVFEPEMEDVKMRIYRCPRQRYLGGVIKRGAKPTDYLSEYWSAHKEEVLAAIREAAVREIVEMLRVSLL